MHVWVYAAINAIAEKSAVPPLVVKNADGDVMDSPLPKKPNSMQTWKEMEQLIAIWLELTGNAYIHHDKDMDEFYPLRPSRVKICPADDGRSVMGYGYNHTPTNNNVTTARLLRPGESNQNAWMHDDPEILEWTDKEFIARYLTRFEDYERWVTKGYIQKQGISEDEQKNWTAYEAGEVIHFKYPSPTSDFYGLPPIYPLLLGLRTELHARHWNKNFFENGAIPPGILILPKIIPKEEFENIKNNFTKQFGGTKNRGKPVILQGGEMGAEYKAFPGQHTDLEFLQGLDKGRDETLGVLQVPPEILGINMGGSHSSGSSPGRKEIHGRFWTDTIMPKQEMKAEKWTQHYEDMLPDGHEMAYDYDKVEDLKPDWETKAKTSPLVTKGIMSIEEYREKVLNLPPQPEGTLMIPSNVQLIRVNGDIPIDVAPEPDALPTPDPNTMKEVAP